MSSHKCIDRIVSGLLYLYDIEPEPEFTTSVSAFQSTLSSAFSGIKDDGDLFCICQELYDEINPLSGRLPVFSNDYFIVASAYQVASTELLLRFISRDIEKGRKSLLKKGPLHRAYVGGYKSNEELGRIDSARLRCGDVVLMPTGLKSVSINNYLFFLEKMFIPQGITIHLDPEEFYLRNMKPEHFRTN